MFRKALVAVLFATAACSPASSTEGAVLVIVDFSADATATCVRVAVRDEVGVETLTEPIATDRSKPLRVGVKRNQMPSKVMVHARGFSDAACKSPTAPLERSEDAEVTFPRGRVSTVQLTLVRRPFAKDEDGDGFASVQTGGDDCDDADKLVNPGTKEICGNGLDDNCSRKKDCEETVCADQRCGVGIGALCTSLSCIEIACTDGQDNDLDGTLDCADQDCAGAQCRNQGICTNGACSGASSEKDLCDDGKDNDADQKIDCADPDCQGSLCKGTDPCVTQAKCDSSGACGGGIPVQCKSPPGGCFGATGACIAGDGGCSYPVLAGASCDDGNGCTASDTCSDAGVCQGFGNACSANVQCLVPMGCNPDAGCLYQVTAGASCSDGNSCTTVDQCLSDAGCTGTAVSCTAPACKSGGVCVNDAGCVFDNLDAGAACDGGVCNGFGACVVFPYVPSNFEPIQLANPPGPVVLGCGAIQLDTNSADGGVEFSSWCDAGIPPWKIIAQPGGGSAALVTVGDLQIGAGTELEVSGSRPLILASIGTIEVIGTVRTRAGSLDCADGGAGAPHDGEAGAGGGAFGRPGGQGGDGRGGSPNGAAAGVTNGNATLQPLRGGCPGGGNTRGGGAVQLSASQSLIITGRVAAPGQGGAQTPVGRGGNGGGSGGGILLEGNYVSVGPGAAITANGGGGAQGGAVIAAQGAAGDPGSITSSAPAAGGSGALAGGNGGNGGARDAGASQGGNGFNVLGADRSAGGGGGGVGRVRVTTATTCGFDVNAVLSPQPTSNRPDAGCP